MNCITHKAFIIHKNVACRLDYDDRMSCVHDMGSIEHNVPTKYNV